MKRAQDLRNFYGIDNAKQRAPFFELALAWPERSPTKTWAFYPSPQAVRTKLDAETPAWKQPLWQWIKRFGAWPVSIETLSGMFDFNQAPFYQSFMEVRVERSKQRVVFLLHGANGPVRWRDLHVATDAGLNGQADEPVQFVVEMPERPAIDRIK